MLKALKVQMESLKLKEANDMKKYLLLTTLIFITTSCTTVVKNWNTPYIDTNETLQLYYGMPKDDVLSALGNPLYVKKGWPGGKTNEIVWVYEVRTQYVASDVASPTGEITIVKTPSSRKPNIPGFVIHKLSITFKDGKLNHWEALEEDKAPKSVISKAESDTSTDIKTTTSTKKEGWSIQPKLTRAFDNWDGYVNIDGDWWGNQSYVAGDDTSLRLGLNIGKPMLGMLIGFDFSFGTGAGLMLFADKAIGSWHLVLSMGKDIYEGSYKTEGFSKIGVFKDFGRASYGLERMGREGGNLNANSTFVTMKYNLAK